MNEDPNDLQLPDAPEEPAPAPPQEESHAPQIDLDQAYDVIARTEGWDPRLTRYEIQEHKRRVQEFEREKKEWEKERARRYEQPHEETNDPYLRRIAGIERIILEEREERKREQEMNQLVTRLSQDLHQSYVANARQSGMTPEQMDGQAAEFYEILNDMYPEPGMIREIGVERATRNAFRVFSSSNRRPSRPMVNGRGPTATRTIPGSPQPYVPQGNGNVLPPSEDLSPEQLQGETDQQYLARLMRIVDAAGLKRLPDGARVTSRG